MGTMIAALLVIAALLIPPPPAQQRLQSLCRQPRDGPRKKHRTSTDIDALDIADDIDLYAVALRAGLPPVAAVGILARCGSVRLQGRWATVEKLLAVGVKAERAWEPIAEIPALTELAGLAGGAHNSGAKIHQGATRISRKLREKSLDEATAKAERAGVFIAMPLTVCFLPAFFVLGLAPVVIGLINDVF